MSKFRSDGDELVPREPSEVDGAVWLVAMVGQTRGFHVGQNDIVYIDASR